MQSAEVTDPAVALLFPAAQLLHEVALPPEYVPAAQTTHGEPPAPEEPASQALQSLGWALPSTTLPVPGAQSVQEVDPMGALSAMYVYCGRKREKLGKFVRRCRF
jgi:hypothetical protein